MEIQSTSVDPINHSHHKIEEVHLRLPHDIRNHLLPWRVWRTNKIHTFSSTYDVPSRKSLAASTRKVQSKRRVTKGAVANALFDLFVAGTTGVNKGLKTALFKFIETKSTNLAEKGALNIVVRCNIQRWKQSTSFMDTITHLALASSQFTPPPPIAQFIKTHMNETTDEWRLAKAEGFPPADIGNPLLRISLLLFSGDKEDPREHRQSRWKSSAPKKKD